MAPMAPMAPMAQYLNLSVSCGKLCREFVPLGLNDLFHLTPVSFCVGLWITIQEEIYIDIYIDIYR